MKAVWKCPFCGFKGSYDEVLEHLKEAHNIEHPEAVDMKGYWCWESDYDLHAGYKFTSNLLSITIDCELEELPNPPCCGRISIEALEFLFRKVKEFLKAENIPYKDIYLSTKGPWEIWDGMYVNQAVTFDVVIDASKIPVCEDLLKSEDI